MIKVKTTLILSFICAFFTYSFWECIKNTFGISIFYVGTSLSFVGYTYVIYRLIKIIEIRKNKRFLLISANIIHLTSINNLLDEMFFDPTIININEYIGYFLITILIIYKHRKNGD